MAIRQTRKTDNGNKEGVKGRNYMWQAIFLIITAVTSSGGTVFGLQVFSPTNVQVQLDMEYIRDEIEILKQDYYNYKENQVRITRLKEGNIALKLEHLTDDVEEIKLLLTDVSNDLKEHNNK